DEAVGLDGAQDRARVRIDLMDQAGPVRADPERAFGPGEPGVAATGRRRGGGEPAVRFWIDLLNAILGDLKQVFSVEGGARMRSNIDRAHRRPGRRIKCAQFVSGGKPDILTVVGDAMDAIRARKRAVFA